jgi:hypothetical protein
MSFHRGQWGAEFSIATGFAGVGALRFTSPTHAWLIDFGATYDHTSTSGIRESRTTASLDLGTRAYHALRRRLYRLTTFGVSLNYRRSPASPGTTTETFGGGLFADLGATWLVTPELGIGARWRAAISYGHGKVSGAGVSSTADGVSVSLGPLLLAGQIYF